MLPTKKKRTKKPAELSVKCRVCGGPAAPHIHYGSICCYSCRAFFRRSCGRSYYCKQGKGSCIITESERKCKLCRFNKCLKVGMRPELVDINAGCDRNNENCEQGESQEPNQEYFLQNKRTETTNEDLEETDSVGELCEILPSFDSPSHHVVESYIENCFTNLLKNVGVNDIAEEMDVEMEENKILMPFKKRNNVKEWFPYCENLSLIGEPNMQLTLEESMFINQRVVDNRALIFQLHENCMKYYDKKLAYKSAEGFEAENRSCLNIFRKNAVEIFNFPIPPQDSSFSEIVKRRFYCCSIVALGVRMYGGPDVDCFPHNSNFYQKYSFLLQSPWASSMEQEVSVLKTLMMLGQIVGADKRLEVLLTSAVMRGFRDDFQNTHCSTKNDLSSIKPGLAKMVSGTLTGYQFSLLLYRYLRHSRSQVEADTIYKMLESLVPQLYVATHTFYHERLKI